MMNMLLTPLLAAVVAADQHADMWAETVAQAQVSETVQTTAATTHSAPLQLAQAGLPGDGRPPPMPMYRPGDGPAHMGPAHMGPPPGFGDHPPGPPFLRGLELTEAQQDKVFEIMHAQAPLLRQRMRELHKAHEELHALTRAERFDEARATAAADTGARAAAAIAFIHARSEAAIWQALAPEQRKQASEMSPRPYDGPPMPPHGAMRPPR